MTALVIVQDTREKKPLTFPNTGVVVAGLKTGDYSIQGYEDKFCVEHKSIKDLIGTCDHNSYKKPQGSNYARFSRELQRMQSTFDFYAIAISGHAKQILPECNKIYQMQRKQGYKRIVTPEVRFKGVIGSLKALRADYNAHFYFFGSRLLAADWILEQAKYYVRNEKKSKGTK
jgi:hypothetical protein